MVRRINLVPVAERARTKTDVGALALVIVGLIVLAAIGFSYYYFSNDLSTKQDELAQLQAENARVQAELASLAGFDALAQKKEQAQAVVQSLYTGRTLVSQVLGDLSLVIPDNAWLTTLSVDAPVNAVAGADAGTGAASTGSVDIQGSTYSFEDVATFLVRMGLVPGFVDVNLASAASAAGGYDPNKTVKTFSVGAGLVNTQDPAAPLPLTLIEVGTP